MIILQWIQDLPAILQQIVGFLIAVIAVATTLSGVFTAFKWKRGSDYMAAIGVDIGKLVALLQGFQPMNKAFGPRRTMPKDADDFKTDNVVKFGCIVILSAIAGLSQSACTNFQQKINTVLEAESKLQAQEQQIIVIAQLNVALLPADKQAQALKIIGDADASFNEAIVTKSATLQAINDGLSSDWTKLGQDISAAATALEQLASILLQFGAEPAKVNAFVADVKATQVYTLSRISK